MRVGEISRGFQLRGVCVALWMVGKFLPVGDKVVRTEVKMVRISFEDVLSISILVSV